MQLNARLGVRVLFAGTLAVFALELVPFVVGHHEPYPALIMPGFIGHPLKDGELTVREPEVKVHFSDGSTRTAPYQKVLPPSEIVPLPVFITAFNDDGFLSDQAKIAWLKSRIELMYPGLRPVSMDILWRTILYRRDQTPAVDTSSKKVNLHVDF